MASDSKYGRWDGSLQMFCVDPIKIHVAQPSDPPGTPLIQQDGATDAEYNRLMNGLEYLKLRAERGEVGALSVVGQAPTIKEITEQPPKPEPKGPTSTPNPAYSSAPSAGWTPGPAHPDYQPESPSDLHLDDFYGLPGD